ncbi:MAG TPA: hypothetical protein DEQ02_02125 [Ruminococcaceae bacterium]|nr:hypothetical protein [Oscillospiraceae bacterium]
MSFTHVSVFGTESTDLALAKPVSSDSAVTAAANQPLYAVDNDDATAWVPDGPGKYLQLDIGARQNIYGINLVWPNDSDRDYAILASIDGSTWYKYFDGSTTEAADVHSIYIPNAQYLRVLDKKGEGLASFEVFGSAPAEAKTIFPEANLLANPNFEDNAAADISSWYKLAVTDASAVQSTTSGSTARPEYNISHGTIGDRYAYMYAAMPYSASLYQPVTGLPNGIYELRGWVKRGHPEAGTEQAELYAYVENYGGETIVNNLLETVPRTNATYANNTGNTTAGRYPYTEIVIGNIHVTNGQLTVGFFANAPANNGANSSYAFIDDFSLRQISQDPAYPPDGETFNGYVNIGIAGGNVSAEFNLATSDVSKTPLAIIAAYRENGTLADQKMEPLNFNGKSVLSYSLELDGYNPNYTYVAYLWDSVTYVPIMEKTVMSVKSVEEINVFPLSTDGYTLPDEVTVRYNNSPNGIGTLPVTWDGAPAVFSEIGEYVIMGTVEGTDIPATANVTVKGANLLSNPTLDTWDSTTGASPTGWVRSSTTGSRFSRDAGAKNQHTPGGGAHYSASYYLGGTAAGANVHLYQTLNLEPGKYVLSCYTQGLILPGSTGGVTLYHSTGTTAPTGQSSPITSYNGVGDWQNPTYTFTVTSAGNISVGVVCNLNNGTWLQVDDFELSKIG